MKNNRVTFAFACLGLLLAACGCHRESDATLQERLVGTWRHTMSEGSSNTIITDLTFTVTTNGNYLSSITVPQPHSLQGIARIKNGLLVVTVTNVDSANLPAAETDNQTIIRLEDDELVTVSEGSSLTNHFRKFWPTDR